MNVTCTSDLHGWLPKLSGGDLLIVAGDLTTSDTKEQHSEFCEWLDAQSYKMKIVIAGNHDNNIDVDEIESMSNCRYLCDSGAEFCGMKIWGSPHTTKFPNQNPHAMAFAAEFDDHLDEKWALIPDDVDILITHTPPFGILDHAYSRYPDFAWKNFGSRSLRAHLYSERIKPKLHVFGHCHEGYGGIRKMLDFPGVIFINAAHMDESYLPTNAPIDIKL